MTPEELDAIVLEYFTEFMQDGFDLNSDNSLNDIFHVLFEAGFMACLAASNESDEEEE
jgi:hypothetical protein